MADPTPGLAPSNSTTVGLGAGALATIIVWLLSTRGIFVPAGIETAIGVVVTTVAGYFPQSGRK